MALANSGARKDQVLAKQIVEFVKSMPMLRQREMPQRTPEPLSQTRNEPTLER